MLRVLHEAGSVRARLRVLASYPPPSLTALALSLLSGLGGAPALVNYATVSALSARTAAATADSSASSATSTASTFLPPPLSLSPLPRHISNYCTAPCSPPPPLSPNSSLAAAAAAHAASRRVEVSPHPRDL